MRLHKVGVAVRGLFLVVGFMFVFGFSAEAATKANTAKTNITPAKTNMPIYVGSTKDQVYHRPACPKVKGIDKKDMIMIVGENKVAEVGYKACQCAKKK